MPKSGDCIISGEWIILIMLCSLFIALSGAVLPERLTKPRTGKALYTILGLILGLGLFASRKIFNFNLESFGFLAIWLIIILAAFVTYGLAKVGMRKDLAVTFSYCLMFMTFYMLTPSLVDVIADIKRFSAGDENIENELQRRYHATNDKTKREDISKKYQLEKRKIDIFDFWKSHEGNVNQFLNHFDPYIHNAATFMEQNNPKEAVSPIKSAIVIIDKLHNVIRKLKSHEKNILRISKKEQKVEEKEKKGR